MKTIFEMKGENYYENLYLILYASLSLQLCESIIVENINHKHRCFSTLFDDDFVFNREMFMSKIKNGTKISF